MSIFDDPTKETPWTEIEGALKRDEPGWIAGTLFMVNNMPKKRLVVIKSNEMQLKISISCPGFERLEFRPCEEVKFSLKGAMVKANKTSTPGALQFILIFESGVAVRLGNNEVVDLWQSEYYALSYLASTYCALFS